jgi:hypothetical protein
VASGERGEIDDGAHVTFDARYNRSADDARSNNLLFEQAGVTLRSPS